MTMDGSERRAACESTPSERLGFLRAWFADPLRVAAVAPSSPSLARLITGGVLPTHVPVLELGPGTGVFTEALLLRGVPEHALTLVEAGDRFALELERKFPRARVLCMDAAHLGQGTPVEEKFGAVVSGLPLVSMPRRKIRAILAAAFASMRQGAAFYQFTYTPWCPVPRPVLEQMGLRARRVGRAVRNLPPATVYRITQRGARRGSTEIGRLDR